jgi:hypothetical protein
MLNQTYGDLRAPSRAIRGADERVTPAHLEHGVSSRQRHAAKHRTDDPEFRIAAMSREEVPFAIGLAANEGWNPGLHDAETFHVADPPALLVGALGGGADRLHLGGPLSGQTSVSSGCISSFPVSAARLRNPAVECRDERLTGCNVGLERRDRAAGKLSPVRVSSWPTAISASSSPRRLSKSQTDGVVVA